MVAFFACAHFHFTLSITGGKNITFVSSRVLMDFRLKRRLLILLAARSLCDIK